MNPTIQTSTFVRVLRTPLGQLLRGRVTGPIAAAATRAASPQPIALPEPAESLVKRIVRRTRLWKSERAAVTAELVSHFLDGLEAGASIEQLVASFGDERQAAKLIRRSKIRNRPLPWHAWRWMFRATLALCLGYLVLAAYFSAAVRRRRWITSPR